MRTAMSNASQNRGFSLVELMVAVVIAIITGLAVLLVLSSYESRKTSRSTMYAPTAALISASLPTVTVRLRDS